MATTVTCDSCKKGFAQSESRSIEFFNWAHTCPTCYRKAALYQVGDFAPCHEKASNSFGELCFECGRAVGAKPLYMEVNTSWQIIARGSDSKNSQGCFPIGLTCANKFAKGILFRFEDEVYAAWEQAKKEA